MISSTRIFLGFFSLGMFVAGCAGLDSAESQVASDGDEGTAASAQSTNMGSVVFQNVSVADPTQAAAELAMPSQLWPSGCVTKAQSATNPSVVTVTFTDCTGPFGLVHLDGEETVTLSAGPSGALQASLEGVNLTANGKPITQSATALITFPTSTTRSVAWTGSWQRTDDAGEVVNHTTSLTIAADLTTGCRTATGTAKTMVAAREVDTTITNLQICVDSVGIEACPSGSVDFDGVTSGKTLEVKFNGSADAAVTGPRGDTFEVPLVCVAATGS
jgi:hypothetical protein